MCNMKGNIKLTLVLLVLVLPVLLSGGQESFYKAVCNGDTQLVKKVLTKKPSILNKLNEEGKSPLHLAIKGKQKDMVVLLLKMGADVNLKTEKNKRSPLHYVAITGDVEIAEMLLKKGAQIDSREIDNETPLYYAGFHGHNPLITLLLAKGASLKGEWTENDNSPMSYAVNGKHLDTLQLLVSHGADLKMTSKKGYGLMHMAAWGGEKDIITYLLKAGVPADTMTDYGRTPLHNATLAGKLDAMAILIKAGADVNAHGKTENSSPLYYAVRNGNAKGTALLLKAGADAAYVYPKDKKNLLHIAALKGYGKITKMLLSKGANPNLKDGTDSMPLQYAAQYGHSKTAEILLAGGAETVKVNKNFGPSKLLKKQLTKGDALVWYLGHSGWAVKTSSHFLVFDYFKGEHRADEPYLVNGNINPEELKGLKTLVFSSHAHGDHYMSEIFTWREAGADVEYVMGFEPKDKDKSLYTYVGAREKKAVGDVKVLAIKSNDSGVGFYVFVDGLSIFHMGDHANRKQDFSGPYKAEIDFLAEHKLKPDLLFTPISGCGFGDQVAVQKGVYYTAKTLSPGIIFPMHAGSDSQRYYDFAQTATEKGLKPAFYCARNTGDYFFFRPGHVEQAAIYTPDGIKTDMGKKKLAKADAAACNKR